MVQVSRQYQSVNEHNNKLIELLQRLGDSGELSSDNVQKIRDILAKASTLFLSLSDL